MLSNINNLNNFLQIYTPESFEQYWAYGPYFQKLVTDFSPYIAAGGTQVNSRLANSNWVANRTDINGYTPLSGSDIPISFPLVEKDVTVAFTELQWATMIPEVLLNTFAPGMGLGMANTLIVDTIASLSGSSATQFINSGSFSYASASYCANLLDKAGVPRTNRNLVLAPDYFFQLNQTLSPTYIYGNPSAIQEYESVRVGAFDTYQYAGIRDETAYNAATVATLNSNGTGPLWTQLYGIASHKGALAFASRPPLEVNNGLVTAVNKTDPTSKLTYQNRITYLQQAGQWMVSGVQIYGCSAGNVSGSVLIING